MSKITATLCLTHQLPEDQPSSIGLVCRECKRRLLASPPNGRCLSFWESQPFDQHGEPGSVFALIWDDFQIRSLHPAKALADLEREIAEYGLQRVDWRRP